MVAGATDEFITRKTEGIHKWIWQALKCGCTVVTLLDGSTSTT